MSKKAFYILIGLLIVSILALFVLFGGKTNAPSTDANPAAAVQTQQPSTTDTLEKFMASDVAKHATGSDCWTIVNGSVYDITSYVPRHPGGDEILQACGADGTSLFTQRKTANGESVGSGTPHSSTAQNQLSSLKIGTLTQ